MGLQSIKLLTIEYQKGHTSYEERAHFLVFKKVGNNVPQCLPCFTAPCPLHYNMLSIYIHEHLQSVNMKPYLAKGDPIAD